MQTQQLIAGGRNPDAARPPDARRCSTRSPKAAGSTPSRATRSRRAPIAFCASSSIGCRWSPTSRRRCCRPSSRALDALRPLPRLRQTATPSPTVLTGHMEQVQRLLCAPVRESAGADARTGSRSGLHRRRPTTTETLDRLNEMGFRPSLEASATVRRWLAGGHRALRAATRARSHLTELVPVLIEADCAYGHPERRSRRFDRFLAHLHGGGRLLSLLRQNPDLLAPHRPRARHRAAARRHPCAPSACDRRADRPELLRRAAGRRRTSSRGSQRHCLRGALRRGLSRPRSACSGRSTCS